MAFNRKTLASINLGASCDKISTKDAVVAQPTDIPAPLMASGVGPLPSPVSFASAESTDYCLSALFRTTHSNTLSKESTTSWTLFSDVGKMPTSSAESTDYGVGALFQSNKTAPDTQSTTNSPMCLSWEPMSIENAWTDPVLRSKSSCVCQRSLPKEIRLADAIPLTPVNSSQHSMESSVKLEVICEGDETQSEDLEPQSPTWSAMRERALQSEDLYEYVVKACDNSPPSLSAIIKCAEDIFADYRALLKELAEQHTA